MAHFNDLLPQLRAKAQKAVHNKSIPEPSSLEVGEAGEYLQAYREFWRRIGEGGSETPDDIVEIWWRETFGKIHPVTYLGISLLNSSSIIAAQHQAAQTAYYVIFASGINSLLWEDEIDSFLKGLENTGE